MNGNNNAVCSICNKPYKLCTSCKDTPFKSWRTVTDSINCYKIYLALAEYNDTKNLAVARESLGQCDLTELDSFDTDIKTVIKKILAKEPYYAKHKKSK